MQQQSKNIRINVALLKHRNYEDRAKHTLADGYTLDELEQVSEYFLRCDNGPDLRNRVDFLIGHSILGRGESKRMMQLPDLFSLEMAKEGPTECFALVITMDKGKTNQFGRVEYGAAIRHAHALTCPVGALALYFFHRWHVEAEEFPNMTTREKWYDIHVMKGTDRLKQISYSTQAKAYKRAFKAVGISTAKVTHAPRGSAARHMNEEDVPDNQQRRVGRWGKDKMLGCYMTDLPKQAMRALAGFSTRQGGFWLPRAAVTPPVDLQAQVFPEIEEWEAKFRAEEVQKDVAGPAFLRLLKHLRVVLLQVILFDHLHAGSNSTNPSSSRTRSFCEKGFRLWVSGETAFLKGGSSTSLPRTFPEWRLASVAQQTCSLSWQCRA